MILKKNVEVKCEGCIFLDFKDVIIHPKFYMGFHEGANSYEDEVDKEEKIWCKKLGSSPSEKQINKCKARRYYKMHNS